MFVADLVFAFLLAALVVGLLTVSGRPGPWGGALWFFLVVFLGAWAVGTWAQPLGPMAWGVAWLPFVVGALLLGLLVAAVPGPPRRPGRAPGPEPGTEATVGAVGIFFWLLLLALLVVIGLGYAFA